MYLNFHAAYLSFDTRRQRWAVYNKSSYNSSEFSLFNHFSAAIWTPSSQAKQIPLR